MMALFLAKLSNNCSGAICSGCLGTSIPTSGRPITAKASVIFGRGRFGSFRLRVPMIVNPKPDCNIVKMDSVLPRSEEHTSELQSRGHLVCRLLLEKKKKYQHAKCMI